jgi:hypothetical protein
MRTLDELLKLHPGATVKSVKSIKEKTPSADFELQQVVKLVNVNEAPLVKWSDQDTPMGLSPESAAALHKWMREVERDRKIANLKAERERGLSEIVTA